MTIDKMTTIDVLKHLQKASAIVEQYIENHGGDDGCVAFHESRRDVLHTAFAPIEYVFNNTMMEG